MSKKTPLQPHQNPRQKCVTGHLPYPTQEAAQRACDEHARDERRHGVAGKAWKRLNVFKCRTCPAFHVGHSKKSLMAKPVEEALPENVQQQTPEDVQRRQVFMAREARRHFERAAARYRQLAKSGGLDADYYDSLAYAMLEAMRHCR